MPFANKALSLHLPELSHIFESILDRDDLMQEDRILIKIPDHIFFFVD